MNQRALIIALVAFAVIIAGMFAYAYTKRAELNRDVPAQELPEDDEDTQSVERVTAKHFFDGTTHTVAGEIMMPTPCDLLDGEAIVRESMPEQVTVALSVINTSETCAQVVTAQRFKVDFEASADAEITATLDGAPVILNLIEAGPDEDPDDFEIFIKG